MAKILISMVDVTVFLVISGLVSKDFRCVVDGASVSMDQAIVPFNL
jgi:hypothetical protein